jgi:branched-chain amino acid transport system substrate-binding protein
LTSRGVTLVCIVCLAAALLRCAPWRPTEPAPTSTAAGPVRVGIVTSISGSLARFGQAHLQGYDLALQEINAAGGVLGEPLKLIFEDDGSDPAAAAAAVEKLATQDQVPVVIGAYSSSATLLAAGMAERYQVPLIVPTAAADDITGQGYRWIFRIAAPSRVYIQTILDFMDQVGDPEQLAIVFENTGFGTSIAEAVDGEAHLRGKTIVAYHAYQAGATDFRPLLEQVKAAEPDAVLFVSYLDDAVSLMEQSRAIDFHAPMVTAAGAGFGLPDFPQLAGPAAEYTISVTQWTPDAQWPGVAEFTTRFRDKYGYAPQYHSAEAYVSLHLAADALRRAATTERSAVREALQITQLTTIFGDIRFDAQGQNDHPMLVTQVIDGDFVTVYPPDVAVRDPVYPMPAWDQRAGGAALEDSP